MRWLVLLTIAMFLASPARSEDCRTISDSLLRLRCYDSREQAPPRSSPEAPDFGTYPAQPYRGPVVLPDFDHREKSYASFRTRIRNGVKNGPNFAGHLARVVDADAEQLAVVGFAQFEILGYG